MTECAHEKGFRTVGGGWTHRRGARAADRSARRRRTVMGGGRSAPGGGGASRPPGSRLMERRNIGPDDIRSDRVRASPRPCMVFNGM
ncbi:hypothetical protein GCM10009678_50260 [Actinomadura kijaniata]